MNNLSLVTRAVAGILAEDLAPLQELTADNAVLTVSTPGSGPAAPRARGRDAVTTYFRSLGAIPTFWRVPFEERDAEVLVLGHEHFTVAGGLEAESDFALVFGLEDGLVRSLRVVEGHLPDTVTRTLPEHPIFTGQSNFMLC
jgi:hypothetical protein